VRLRPAALLFFALVAQGVAAAPITVPIYIEDSHAGSFYWLADHVDLDEEYTLIHFDAHSDASAIFDSDKLRERLRRVGSLEERQEILKRWRQAGAIQCYNWIEPLIPAPIARVLWVHRTGRNEQEKARAQLDGHLEASPRAAGSFRGRYRAVRFDQLRAELKSEPPVIVTIDLDYFADVPANQRAAEFERVWKFVSECRNLSAVTVAISRPYLKDDAQADELLRLALAASLSLPTATIQFEPFATVGNDRSLRARAFRARKEQIPAFILGNASEKLRALILANRGRIFVKSGSATWEHELDNWSSQTAQVRLAVNDHEPSTDDVWRIAQSEAAVIELRSDPWDATLDRIEWIRLMPEYERCNLTATSADQIGFGRGAPPRPRWRETRLAGSERTFALDSGMPGARRLKARVTIGGHIRETPVIEVRRFAGSGFRSALTEQFGLPYLFGSGELMTGNNTGAETGLGADCANFVVYALRREGRLVPWSNPKQLRKYLEPVAKNIRPGEHATSESEIATGLIVHLGSHVAAVMEDRPPLGILDRNDRVAHQLEGAPEMLSLGQLLASRKSDRFDLLRVSAIGPNVDLLVGGDVMLGRTIGAEIQRGTDPLAGVRPLIAHSQQTLVNLECVLSEQGALRPGKPYNLRAPLDTVRVLAGAGISTVSLANNHANDFGTTALLDSITRLKEGNVFPIGAAETTANAYAPHFFSTRTGTTGAIIALDDTDAGAPEIATARDTERVSAALAKARSEASFVFAFVHWGDENTSRVTERQRELARWLIDHGADAVAGSHPHCVQGADSYHGRPIIYSLGNLVFDGAPSLPGWNHGQLLEFNLATGGPIFRLVPVELDARGFPQIAEHEMIKERRFTNRPPKQNGDL
jgi:hypothetical protein